MSGITLVDAHVHLYEGFDLARAFSAALRNFQDLRPTSDLDLCLCLTEDCHHDVFSSLSEMEDTRWSAHPHADGRSIQVRDSESGQGLWLFAGRQIVTAERLEVLALFARPGEAEGLCDGNPLDETVKRVQSAGALPVLPWAFGKWWFSRGQRVSEFLRNCRAPVFLGDNGGRWTGLRGLRPYPLGAAMGCPVLPGSDPLPLSGHEDCIGRYGFSLDGSLDQSAPAESLSAALSSLQRSPDPVGRTATLPEFLLDQWKLRTSRLPSPAARP